jgi:hypothetical protein
MSIDADTRNLAKWLNEEQTRPIDRQALARLLAHVQYPPQRTEQTPVYHLRQYGDVTEEQLDRYMETGDITPPAAQPAPVPLTLGQKQRLWSSVGNKPTLKDRVNAYGLAIEAAHGITKENT